MTSRDWVWRSAISGAVWAAIAIVIITYGGGGRYPPTLTSVAWSLRRGILAAPIIGIVMGSASGLLRDCGMAGRILLAVMTVYLACFLFVLAAFGAGEFRGSHSVWAVLVNSWNMTIAGLTWTGFVLILAPLAYLNHWLISR